MWLQMSELFEQAKIERKLHRKDSKCARSDDSIGAGVVRDERRAEPESNEQLTRDEKRWIRMKKAKAVRRRKTAD